MATKELDILMQRKDENGDIEIHYPITHVGNVVGLQELNSNLTEEMQRLGESVADGKKLVATAISGKPATGEETFLYLAETIDNAQIDISAICNQKGASMPIHPNFNEIVIGLNNIVHFSKSEQISKLTANGTTGSGGIIKLIWTNPNDVNFSGVMIRYKTGSYPTSHTDGSQAYDGAGNSVEVTGLTNSTTYYFRAFAYNFNGGAYTYNDLVSGAQISCVPVAEKGLVTFTSSGTFTVPAGIPKIQVFCVGGGGGGASSFCGTEDFVVGGGGGGGYTKTATLTVTSGTSYAVVVGAGGAAGAGGKVAYPGSTGGASSFGGTLVQANPGIGGSEQRYMKNASCGGSGGGHSVYSTTTGNKGGSNGANGGMYDTSLVVGIGQGTTTRAFGESSNTLYAGGGSSGAWFSYTGQAGGDGGGGKGGNAGTAGTAGTTNTGGGGGGGGVSYAGACAGGKGGSGIVIVRWGYV